jgi:hypothetical protein
MSMAQVGYISLGLMKRPFYKIFYTAINLVILSGLAGCSSSDQGHFTPTVDMTRVYQTLQVRLTQAQPSADPAPTETATMQPSRTLSPTETEDLQSTITPIPTKPVIAPTLQTPLVCDRASAGNPIDLSIPDDTELKPNEAFTKIWRLQNSGSCACDTDYVASFFYGDQMDAPDNVPLGEVVAPGASIDLSVEMVAPQTPGTYQGNWKLRNAGGTFFGIGPNGDAPFWVRIIVIEEVTQTLAPTIQPSETPEATEVSLPSPTPTHTPIVQIGGEVFLAPGDFIDLDSLQLNTGQDEDLAFQAGANNIHWLIPQEDVLLGVRR